MNNKRSKGSGRRTKKRGKKSKHKKKREVVQKERNRNEKIGLEHDAQNDFRDQAFFLCDNFFGNNTK